MDRTLQLATAHGLPLQEKNTKGTKSLLLVLLTDLEDADEASLVQHFQRR